MIKSEKYSLHLCITLILASLWTQAESPIEELAKRIVPGYAKNIVYQKLEGIGTQDYFELESKDKKLVIRGNSYNSMAYGLNHYLKYYCNTGIAIVY